MQQVFHRILDKKTEPDVYPAPLIFNPFLSVTSFHFFILFRTQHRYSFNLSGMEVDFLPVSLVQLNSFMPISVSASNIAQLFKKDKAAVLEFLYERYAAVLYGSILRACKDRTIADKILINTFLSLKSTDFHNTNNKTLLVVLLHYTKIITQQHCRENQVIIDYSVRDEKDQPLIDPLLYNALSIKQLAAVKNISEVELPDQLRKEMIVFRNYIPPDEALAHTSA